MPKVEIGATIGDRRNGARGSVRFGSKADMDRSGSAPASGIGICLAPGFTRAPHPHPGFEVGVLPFGSRWFRPEWNINFTT